GAPRQAAATRIGIGAGKDDAQADVKQHRPDLSQADEMACFLTDANSLLAGRNDLAMKTEPVVVEFLAQLADPAGRDLELLAQVRGARVARHGPDDTPLTGRKGPQPG